MKLKVFTVFDCKVGAHLTPFFMRSTGEAIRAMKATASSPDSQFSKFPSDFTLFEIGVFDDQSASFDMLSTPHSLGVVSEIISTEVQS